MDTVESPSIDHVKRNALFLMAQINRQWRRIIDRKLQPLGLTQAMWMPLMHLARSEEPMRQKDLADSLSVDGSAVVRLIDTLEAGGYVERAGHADRRAKTISLTCLGQTTVKQVNALVDEDRAAVLSCVPDEELAQAFSVLERISDKLAGIEEGPLR